MPRQTACAPDIPLDATRRPTSSSRQAPARILVYRRTSPAPDVALNSQPLESAGVCASILNSRAACLSCAVPLSLHSLPPLPCRRCEARLSAVHVRVPAGRLGSDAHRVIARKSASARAL